MALKKCKDCNREISSRAKMCVYCGAPQKVAGNNPVVGCIGVLIVVGVIFLLVKGISSSDRSAAPGVQAVSAVSPSTFGYLNEIREIAWWELVGNDLYIGFNPVPEDWVVVMKGAALKGNKASGSGFHAWAVSGAQKGWRPGRGPYLGEATARDGRIER